MNRLEGIIVSYNQKRGFGFIAVGENRYFVHATQLPGNCNRGNLAGKAVTFTPAQMEKGPAAFNVEIGGGEEEE